MSKLTRFALVKSTFFNGSHYLRFKMCIIWIHLFLHTQLKIRSNNSATTLPEVSRAVLALLRHRCRSVGGRSVNVRRTAPHQTRFNLLPLQRLAEDVWSTLGISRLCHHNRIIHPDSFGCRADFYRLPDQFNAPPTVASFVAACCRRYCHRCCCRRSSRRQRHERLLVLPSAEIFFHEPCGVRGQRRHSRRRPASRRTGDEPRKRRRRRRQLSKPASSAAAAVLRRPGGVVRQQCATSLDARQPADAAHSDVYRDCLFHVLGALRGDRFRQIISTVTQTTVGARVHVHVARQRQQRRQRVYLLVDERCLPSPVP